MSNLKIGRVQARASLLLFASLCAGVSSSCKTSPPMAGSHTAAVGDDTADPVYDRVVAALRAKFPDAEGTLWSATTGSLDADWLMQTPPKQVWQTVDDHVMAGKTCTNGDTCDPDFHLLRCQATADCGGEGVCLPLLASVSTPGADPASLCVGLADQLVDQIYSTLIKAKRTVDIASLTRPSGRYLTAIENALVFLERSGATPDVRFLFGSKFDTSIDLSRTNAFLSTWYDDLKAKKPDFGLTLSAAQMLKLTSWNHAKIVVVDGLEAIVGGMNFIEEEYLTTQPVFDTSMRVRGGAAFAAVKFVDALWQERSNVVRTLPGTQAPSPQHADASAPAAAGGIKVIAIGRLGGFGENPADAAMAAFLAGADQSIKLSQQDLYNWTNTDGPFGEAEMIAGMSRGVEIDVLKSSVLSRLGYGMFSPKDTFKFFARHFEKAVHRYSIFRADGTYVPDVCRLFHVAPLKYSPQNPTDGQVKSHAKMAVVDDRAFYLGSQNIYFANLAEFGYLVFDPDAAATILNDYWNPAWALSTGSSVACRPDPRG